MSKRRPCMESFSKKVNSLTLTCRGVEIDSELSEHIKEKVIQYRREAIGVINVRRNKKTNQLIYYLTEKCVSELNTQIDMKHLATQLSMDIKDVRKCIEFDASIGASVSNIIDVLMLKINPLIDTYLEDLETHSLMIRETIDLVSEYCTEVYTSDTNIMAVAFLYHHMKAIDVEVDIKELCRSMNVTESIVIKKVKAIDKVSKKILEKM